MKLETFMGSHLINSIFNEAKSSIDTMNMALNFDAVMLLVSFSGELFRSLNQ